jgi:adenosyl cobinamide kinase/adenosyl cobinamide phosphate guanylyltransferase
MSLVLLLGGARSGKSQLAVELAAQSGRAVAFVATAEAGDEEMRDRIARHRADRPRHWQTIEAPRDLIGMLACTAPDDCVVIDCLSLWIANLLQIGEPAIEALALTSATAIAERPGPSIAVSNEVGLGVVPATEIGRHYRDTLGRVNAIWADAAHEALLVIAGRTLPLTPASRSLPRAEGYAHRG